MTYEEARQEAIKRANESKEVWCVVTYGPGSYGAIPDDEALDMAMRMDNDDDFEFVEDIEPEEARK